MSYNFPWASDLLERVGGDCSDTGSFFRLTDMPLSAVVSGLPRAACQPEGVAAGPQPAGWGTLWPAHPWVWALTCGEDFGISSFAFWSFSVQVSWRMTVKS